MIAGEPYEAIMAFPHQEPETTPETREDELTCLQRKLDKRRDQPGYATNVAEIEARIAELQAEAE